MIRPHFKKKEDETGIVEVDGVKIDAASAEVVFVDPDKDIQVVVSDDPENKDGAVVAVMTASAEDVEDEKVLGSAQVEPEGDEDKGEDEARKAEARKRFRARFEARQKAKKEEARKKAVEEARNKFRAHAKKA